VLADRKVRRWLWAAAPAAVAFCVLAAGGASWLRLSEPTEIMPAGTVLSVRLERTLTSSEALLGQAFKARVVSSQAAEGSAAPAPGSEVEGLCVAVRRGEGADRPGYLRVALTGLRDSEGGLMQLQSSAFSRWGGEGERPDPATVPRVSRRPAKPGRLAASESRHTAPGSDEAVVTPETPLNFVVLEPVPVRPKRSP
jgi:hypothetical protein